MGRFYEAERALALFAAAGMRGICEATSSRTRLAALEGLKAERKFPGERDFGFAALLFVHGQPVVPQTGLRKCREILCEPFGSGACLSFRYETIGQADRIRFGRLHPAAGQNQVQTTRIP